MIVKIYKDYKMPTQSGSANINEWILEFMSVDDRFQEQIMGWAGSENMYPNEVKLRFEDKNQAITFAKKNKLDFFMCAGHDVRVEGSSPSWADIERSIS